MQLGLTCVLHTWTRELAFHPHVHCIVTGGGLSLDGTRWVPSPLDFLFPIHVLGKLVRGKFLAGLAELQKRGVLVDELSLRAARRRRERLYSQNWIVYAKRPFGGPEAGSAAPGAGVAGPPKPLNPGLTFALGQREINEGLG